MELDARRSLIRVRTQMLALCLGKRLPEDNLEEFLAPFVRTLERFAENIITQAFQRAETDLDRFPTPKALLGICIDLLPSQNAWRYNFRPSTAKDPETGATVQVLIDPDPSCCRPLPNPKNWKPAPRCGYSRSEHPVVAATGWRCDQYMPSGLGDDAVMFRPQDCPEGRAFLAKLREIAGRDKDGQKIPAAKQISDLAGWIQKHPRPK